MADMDPDDLGVADLLKEPTSGRLIAREQLLADLRSGVPIHPLWHEYLVVMAEPDDAFIEECRSALAVWRVPMASPPSLERLMGDPIGVVADEVLGRVNGKALTGDPWA